MSRHTGPSQLIRKGNARKKNANHRCELPPELSARLLQHLDKRVRAGDTEALILLRSLIHHTPISAWENYAHHLRNQPVR